MPQQEPRDHGRGDHHGRKLQPLNRTLLDGEQAAQFERMKQYPLKVLQIGEGNFLRGFFDWMIHACNRQGLFEGSIAVTQPRPAGAVKIRELAEQDGLYHLLVRGIQNGERIERKEVVSVFSQTVDPYADWQRFLSLAEVPELEIVVSNTTEAGLVYHEADWQPEQPLQSFPGKLTLLLHRRFQHFSGAPDKGLLLLPCELIEGNGDRLKEIVLRHADDWGLSADFITWVSEHNRFLNSLVDRIVTGYPGEEAERLFAEWGCEDRLLNTAEPYYIWAIEGEPELDRRLPLRQAGLNVCWVSDLKPYQLRKVRILNGAHTLLASIGLLNGLQEVREVVEHPAFGPLVRQAVMEEIVPSVPLNTQDMQQYADEVLERFVNPFIRHRLTDIAMNSLSKCKVRLLPTLEAYSENTGNLPPLLTRAFASLLRLYKVRREGSQFVGTGLDGKLLGIRDDEASLQFLADVWEKRERGQFTLAQTLAAILSNTGLWGRDLNALNGLAERIIVLWSEMEVSAP